MEYAPLMSAIQYTRKFSISAAAGYNIYIFQAYANVPRVFACRRWPA
jgi:hypothetical protein